MSAMSRLIVLVVACGLSAFLGYQAGKPTVVASPPAVPAPTKCTCSTKLNIIRAACLIGYCDTAYFAASFLTVVTFRIVEGTPTVLASNVPVNSGESLSRVRQSQ